MENKQILREIEILKADVAEMKQLVRELHNVFIQRLKVEPNQNQKNRTEQSTIRKLKLLKVYHKKT